MDRRLCLAAAGASALSQLVGAAPVSSFDAVLAAWPDFNGTVVAGRGKEIVHSRAIGLADPPAGIPVQLRTRFETGSVSKWIAAIIVMHMVEQGALALDTPITRYLPDYRPDTGARLTLRHLMSHSSGVPNDIQAARKRDPRIAFEQLGQMDAVRRYASGNMQFAPGTDWEYSHANWLIVKAIVERISGRSYRACVADWLTEPLGLLDSGIFSGASSAVPGMAVAYAGTERKVNAVPDYMAMAGGFYSSAPDMLRLMDGVLGGAILGPAARATLMRINRPAQHYALGGRTRIETIAGKEREAAWEDGSNGGFRLVARRVLDDGVTVIVFNNTSYDHQRLGLLASALMETLYA